ncbi:hypothetical protein PIB30_053312 [Stylosanthes scabra]|uniref:Uncharacterized protein n=1 Tax=Stylosanthes scabra TaxID=79078 RepID=A0ABU6YGR6_9FABA|nr:hypothetical protein [Stylosanthes scabra]
MTTARSNFTVSMTISQPQRGSGPKIRIEARVRFKRRFKRLRRPHATAAAAGKIDDSGYKEHAAANQVPKIQKKENGFEFILTSGYFRRKWSSKSDSLSLFASLTTATAKSTAAATENKTDDGTTFIDISLFESLSLSVRYLSLSVEALSLFLSPATTAGFLSTTPTESNEGKGKSAAVRTYSGRGSFVFISLIASPAVSRKQGMVALWMEAAAAFFSGELSLSLSVTALISPSLFSSSRRRRRRWWR